MNGQPTPRPWLVIAPYTNRNVYPIAAKRTDGALSIIGEFVSQGGTPDQCGRNARLAAAAPDLLDALVAMAKQYAPAALDCAEWTLAGNSATDATLRTMRAAIAKATK